MVCHNGIRAAVAKFCGVTRRQDHGNAPHRPNEDFRVFAIRETDTLPSLPRFDPCVSGNR